MQAVKYLYDTLAQGGAAHYGVVYHHQVILKRSQRTVCYVIYMRGKVLARVTLGNKGAQLYVLADHLLCPYHAATLTNALKQTVVGYLCRVGDV